ncbi:MAG TPA: zinc ribbon domain-containing protein [Pyrinomonadaceae bacterium]|jgi:hypothetical protein|nr:zinc ribbon domain-containing protein [Pyrinomonadaceae bacterium]
MYCSACGTPLAPGLSYCNRCGMSLKERSEPNTSSLVTPYLVAISIVGIAGLCVVLGGAIALRNGAHFEEDIVGIFMLMSFFLVSLIEFFLCRQLSRILKASQYLTPATPAPMPGEFRPPQPRALVEPLPSVTENTTRTLEYSRREPSN